MKRIAVLLLSVCFATVASTQPIPVKLNHTVIIDTDCAIDDMRAISILLSRPEISVAAILLSDGSLPPAEGREKVRSLLHTFNRDTIPVAAGDVLKGVNPSWREFNRQINWGDVYVGDTPGMTALDCLSEKLSNTNEKIVLICLGPLTNVAGLIRKDAHLLASIERVIWYNESVDPPMGFNYESDRNSADLVLHSNIRMDVISNLKKQQAVFDTALYAITRLSGTFLASVINDVHSQPAVLEKLYQQHFRLNDDLVALYILNPDLFDINIMSKNIHIRYNQDYDIQGAREAFGDMLKGTYVAEKNVVFNRFPQHREMFNYDVRPIMDSAIAWYGADEWKANVMTDEFHGHLGVFSIVGAKMGIKARELFDAGPDMLRVVTYAGSRPPYSCLTDGIQVSTGATLGMGSIQLASDSVTRPSAVFTFRGRSVRLTLKKEYLERVNTDIQEGIVKFGLMDDGYWKLIRRNALKYWLEWDRDVIFDIEEVGNIGLTRFTEDKRGIMRWLSFSHHIPVC
jgi:pyrimidine-specific ribonucleoside hydrolase